MRNAIEKIRSLRMEIEMLEEMRCEAETQEQRDKLMREIQDKMSILDCYEESCS